MDVHELSDSLSVTRSYYSQASNIVRVPSSIDMTRSPVDPAQSGLYVENIISSHTSRLQHPCRPGLCLQQTGCMDVVGALLLVLLMSC